MARAIETAPRNGKVILVGDDNGFVMMAFWHTASAEQARAFGAGWWAFADADGEPAMIPFTPTRWGETMDEFKRD